MAKKDDQKKNVVRYRRRFRINVGIVVFAIVLVYFLIYLVQYLTTNHISVYEVEKGEIMVSSQYSGLVLRTEEVSYAEESGKLNYYSMEGEKVGYGDLICSIDTEGSLYQQIAAAGLDGNSLTMSDLLNVQEMITSFSDDYSSEQFFDVYSFGDNLNAEVRDSLHLSALENLGEQVYSDSFTLVSAEEDGVLAFYTDGYENVTPETFTANLYQASDYSRDTMSGNTTVSQGQPLYKTVTDENWYMLIPLSSEISAQYLSRMEDSDSTFLLLVTFKKDEVQTYATATVKFYDGEPFLLLSFNSSMVRYISDRYLDVELGSDDDTGLKIPNSAITQKEFFAVPEEYIVSGDSSTDIGVNRVVTDKEGTQYTEYTDVDIYYVDEETGEYYIAGEEIQAGDTLQGVDSDVRYILGKTSVHDGVYNVNKGYAVFKLVDIISSNGEYSIVESGTSYGLSLYDRVALDGDEIVEGEYVN